MTEKQRKFADEYLTDLNVTRAYRTAYPAVKRDETACQAGSRLLRNVNVRAYIDERLEGLRSMKVAEAREVLEYLTAVMRGETVAEIVVTEGQGMGVSVARAMSKHPDQRERLKAAELLAKYHQLLVPRVQLETEHSGGVIVLQEATEGEP